MGRRTPAATPAHRGISAFVSRKGAPAEPSAATSTSLDKRASRPAEIHFQDFAVLKKT